MMDRLSAAASSDVDDVDPVHRLRSAIILMEALCMTGKEVEARKLMREIGGQLGEWSNIPADPGKLRVAVLQRAAAVRTLAPEHRHAQGRQRPGRPRAAFRQRAH